MQATQTIHALLSRSLRLDFNLSCITHGSTRRTHFQPISSPAKIRCLAALLRIIKVITTPTALPLSHCATLTRGPQLPPFRHLPLLRCSRCGNNDYPQVFPIPTCCLCASLPLLEAKLHVRSATEMETLDQSAPPSLLYAAAALWLPVCCRLRTSLLLTDR